MLKFYADESVDAPTSLMNVSGFLMTGDQFVALDEAIQDARGDLPYFHMKERHHLSHPNVYQRLLKLITRDSVICGISASLHINNHEQYSKAKWDGQTLGYWMGKPYTYLLGQTMQTCAKWITDNPTTNDDFVDYVFERGHPSQGDAETFWSQLAKPDSRNLKEYYRYASHSFVDGKGPLGSVLQVCDILAWHINKADREHRPLDDVAAVFPVPIFAMHHTQREICETFINQIHFWDTLAAQKEQRRSQQKQPFPKH